MSLGLDDDDSCCRSCMPSLPASVLGLFPSLLTFSSTSARSLLGFSAVGAMNWVQSQAHTSEYLFLAGRASGSARAVVDEKSQDDGAMNLFSWFCFCIQRRHDMWLSHWRCFSLRHDGIMRGALSFAVRALVRFQRRYVGRSTNQRSFNNPWLLPPYQSRLGGGIDCPFSRTLRYPIQ